MALAHIASRLEMHCVLPLLCIIGITHEHTTSEYIKRLCLVYAVRGAILMSIYNTIQCNTIYNLCGSVFFRSRHLNCVLRSVENGRNDIHMRSSYVQRMYVYMYTNIYMYMFIYIYIYILRF